MSNDSIKLLDKLIKIGWEKKIKILNLSPDEEKIYKDRLLYERNIIISQEYVDYFLIVQDYVNWAKNNDILVGPGRGSGAGSLLAYLLNITEINPIGKICKESKCKNCQTCKNGYGLLFERFLEPTEIEYDFSFNEYSIEEWEKEFMDNEEIEGEIE